MGDRMKLSIRTDRDVTDLPTVDGSRYQAFVAGPSYVSIEIVTDGVEAQEILKRLAGMPGVPAEGEAIERISPLMSPPTYADDILPGRPRGNPSWDAMKARMVMMSEADIDKIVRGDWGARWRVAAEKVRRNVARIEREKAARKRRLTGQPERKQTPWADEVTIEFEEPATPRSPHFNRDIEL
jgi:hypothetical protein